jgi:long-chain fatty acid transport protein
MRRKWNKIARLNKTEVLGETRMIKTTMRILPAAMLLAFSGLASAAGYQALEQNASGLGTAYAGSAAIADNAATLFANPAGMSRLEGFNFSMGVVGVSERHKFRNAGGVASGGNAGESNALPNAYLTWQFTPSLTVGLGISRPYLLDTRYDAGWVGNASGIESELTTVNINPAIAYKINELVSIGAGLNYQTMDVRLTNTTSNFKGDDSALGWNIGALFTLSPAMRVGVAYRSKIEHDVSGTNNAVAARRDIDTPGVFTLSVWQQVSDRWEAMGDLSHTRWKSVDGFDLDNAWRLAWGAGYKYSDQAKLKFGIAYDRSPVNDSKRTVRMPDNDRLWLSLGGQWTFGRNSVVDVGYAYRYMRDAKVRDGAAVGKYDSGAHVVGVQYSVGF